MSAPLLTVLILTLSQTVAPTKNPPRVGVVEYLKAGFAGSTRDLIASAERMPEADYAFKPSEMTAARTFGAVIAHAADGMFGGCARAARVENPSPDVEKRVTAKSDIVAALRESVRFCETVFSSLTEQTATEFVRQGPVEIPRTAALMGILAHNAEMFGISTVYLRGKNLVPPGSDR